MALLEVKDLTYYYPAAERPALQGINLSIQPGEFVLLLGGSGSGKSTLARALAGLVPEFYGGRMGGEVFFQGCPLSRMDQRQLARRVGIVFQEPENQLVMLSAEAELAFGLENLGLKSGEMRQRVAEVLGFLGLQDAARRFSATLSGGEKQKLAIGAVLAMQPRVLILDEPTSQLDPPAAEEILQLLRRLHEDFALTIVLVEQRLERCYHLADRVVLLEEGRLVYQGPPAAAAAWQARQGWPFVPSLAALFARAGVAEPPLTVGQARRLLGQMGEEQRQAVWRAAAEAGFFSYRRHKTARQPSLLEARGVWFAYPEKGDVLRGVDLQLAPGNILALLGPNGAGKTTLLKVLTGLLQPAAGRVLVQGKDLAAIPRSSVGRLVGYLSQQPGDYLYHNTLEEEIQFTRRNLGLEISEQHTRQLLAALKLEEYRQCHPRDLSSGQRQRAALAAVLAADPPLLLLDEPTRGLDARLKKGLGELLKRLAGEGRGIILVTHDVEFAASYAQQVALLFAGEIVAQGEAAPVLGRSLFYAPQVSRLWRFERENEGTPEREAITTDRCF
ncbi:ABC transporter ATP-binding protein [Desulfurispora thermophila]|uniref:ABC transporter ATP-binding protein n=1 Tax=Desulfurispora thermophila TaxID=265470 RepID=UPI00036006D9|nr:ABC transporter ATP-binding protein [Desulfurispora thermophila]